MLQLATHGCAEKGRVSNRVTQALPEEAGNHASVSAICARIFQGESVACVPRQGFICALAGEHNRNPLARELGDKIKRYARRPCDWLILMPDQMWECAKKLLFADQHFMVARPDVI